MRVRRETQQLVTDRLEQIEEHVQFIEDIRRVAPAAFTDRVFDPGGCRKILQDEDLRFFRVFGQQVDKVRIHIVL